MILKYYNQVSHALLYICWNWGLVYLSDAVMVTQLISDRVSFVQGLLTLDCKTGKIDLKYCLWDVLLQDIGFFFFKFCSIGFFKTKFCSKWSYILLDLKINSYWNNLKNLSILKWELIQKGVWIIKAKRFYSNCQNRLFHLLRTPPV